LTSTKTQAELRKVKKEIAQLEKKLKELKARKAGLEQVV
jgi:cell division protein FtsB